MKSKQFMMAAAAAAVGILSLSTTSWGQAFPGAGTDTTPSMGQFSIVINPAFQPAFTGQPGYNSTTKTLTSPLLYDPSTQILRSSNIPVNNTGGSTYQTALSNLTLFPSGTGYAGQPVGTDSVFTQITSMNMTGGGVSVTAGAAATSPTVPNSYGLVTSNQVTPGDSANDFPAHSFFDIFVDVTVPGLGTLSNTTPLVVQNPMINAFPPTVIYVHGNSSAVPLYFDGPNAGLGANTGDLLGIITLAGHGVNGGDAGGSTGPTQAEILNFENAYANMTPAPALPQYSSSGNSDPVAPTSSWGAAGLAILPEPASLALIALGGAVLVLRRRRSV